ncbi:MAG: chemotaxis protein [Oceanospirillaceae bacterium]|nr:chemotaxis protein [Oceanospirillaceae bacterium]
MTFLRNLSIRARLWLIMAAALTCIVLLEAKALSSQYDVMFAAEYTAKENTARSLVNSAHSLLERYQRMVQEGVLSEEEAKKSALDGLRSLRDGDSYFWVHDRSPVMLLNPAVNSLEGTNVGNFEDKAGKKVFREVMQIADASAEGGAITYSWPRPGQNEASTKVSYVRKFDHWGWYIGSGTYPNDIASTFWSSAASTAVMTLIFVGLMAIIIRLISTSIEAPLTQLSHTMSNIAKGDGDLTQRIPVNGEDEITRLSRSFNQFISQIHDIIRESVNASNEVASLGRELAGMGAATRKLTDEQMQESDHVATGATEMSQTIQEIADNADKAADAVKVVEGNSKAGLTTMQNTQAHIADLADQIQSSRASIQSLRSETESIGTVLEVIRGIAEQTNLLALNAAIEAARAGEQGRGFAVVADEVRTLASRTQESTEEIHRTISRLQEQAEATVQSMENSANHSEETSEMSQSACEAIARISDAVVTLTEMNLSVASAVEQQSVAANEISQSINRIAESSNDISNNMSRSDASGQKLAKCSERLSQQVSRFRI